MLINPFMSWRPDQDCVAVDAFTVNWTSWASIYAFPPFTLIQKTLGKLKKRPSRGAAHHTTLAHSRVVSTDVEAADTEKESSSVGPLRRSSSPTQTTSASGSLLIRKAVHAQGIQGRTCEITCAFGRESTKRQYASYLSR